MNNHYTRQEAVELAREFDEDAFKWDGIGSDTLLSTINAAITRKLAEKELEVVRLREVLGSLVRSGELQMDDDKEQKYVEVSKSGIRKARKLLSTPPTTEALEEYVAARMAEREDRRDAERYRMCRTLIKDFAPYQIDEKCDAAIEAEKVGKK